MYISIEAFSYRSEASIADFNYSIINLRGERKSENCARYAAYFMGVVRAALSRKKDSFSFPFFFNTLDKKSINNSFIWREGGRSEF